MIPSVSEYFTEDFQDRVLPSKDYALNTSEMRINGSVEDLDAVKQAVYFILNTERYHYLIYSWDYGVELQDLMGQPMSYVIPEVERRITEALIQDERIESVTDFEFEKEKETLKVSFKIASIFGSFESGVEINV